MVELHAFGDVPFKSHKTGLVNLILIFLFSLLPHTASVSCQVEKVKKPVHTKDLLASKVFIGAVGGAGSWLSPPFLLPSLEGQASCPSRPSASPRSAARPWPRRRRARRPRPRPRKGGGKSRREGGGNGGKHKNIGAEQPLEVPEPSPCPQDQGCTRPGADRSVLDSGRKVPDGCHVLGGQRALTLVGWAAGFSLVSFSQVSGCFDPDITKPSVAVSLGCCAGWNQAAKPQVHLLPDPLRWSCGTADPGARYWNLLRVSLLG
ncbi:uncharacterized protein LOC121347843 isoform X3 [Onychostruthus taczanowskii]|uniref:uncharacterized protein LOC121347843 isoform X3 n=1 Tax=Onychostruthus taczanowskii TaxID=356909 RepID=UPI001B8080FF|nr:uncharacterized protein LOC121347843 isoform X3 [Onychostruthus taczanowskii]